ncbi:MAG TPA: glycosyltransferase family 4 protein, partial [Rhizomicrobium sp.]
MRVLFVHYGGPKLAGSEIALLELLGGLRRRGIVPFLWCNAFVMEQAAREMDIPVWRDEFTHYLDYSSPPFSLSGYRQLVKKGMARIAETGAEIVVCNSAAPAQWMSLACRRKAVPWLIYMHSRYLKRSRYVLGMHLADEIVAVTSAIAKPLLIDGMEPDRISVIHNGFDEIKFLQGRAENLRTELSIPPDRVVGAMAGSLLRLKGHDILFEAMRLMPEPPPILVIGDGPERKTLETLAAGLPVHFLGHRAELGAILRDAADFLVAP